MNEIIDREYEWVARFTYEGTPASIPTMALVVLAETREDAIDAITAVLGVGPEQVDVERVQGRVFF